MAGNQNDSDYASSGGGGGGGITVGSTTSDGTANALLKTNGAAQVVSSSVTSDGTNTAIPEILLVGVGSVSTARQMFIQQWVSQNASVAVYQQQPIPSGALTFEGFNQADSSLLTDSTPMLGYTDGGSLGQLQWSASGWGVISEYGYCFYQASVNNLLSLGRSDVDLRVNRLGNNPVGLTLRYSDDANLAYVSGSDGVIGGATVVNGNYLYYQFSAGSGWTTLRAVANGNLMSVYADSTLVGTFPIPASLNGERHGLKYAGNLGFFKNFVAYPVN